MEPWFTHRILYRIFNLKVKYILESPLRIGSGRVFKLSSPIDLPVIRIKIGDLETPYIPGSSIKGVFRSSSEYIVRSAGLPACSRGEGCRVNLDRPLQNCLRNLYRSTTIKDVYSILQNYCIVCKVFGSGSYGSHIEFKDAYPSDSVTTGIKTGIAIDRRSGAAKRGALYTIEYVNPGSTFDGEITMINLPNYCIGLIANVIELINLGIIKIGGMKSRGFGKVRIDIVESNMTLSQNGGLIQVKEKTIVKSLDEYDEDVEYDPNDPIKYLNACRGVWERYVQKVKT